MEFHFRPKSQENGVQISILSNFHFIENETAKFFRFPFSANVPISFKMQHPGTRKQCWRVSTAHPTFLSYKTYFQNKMNFRKHVCLHVLFQPHHINSSLQVEANAARQKTTVQWRWMRNRFPFSTKMVLTQTTFPFCRISILSRMSLQGFWSPDFHSIEFPFHREGTVPPLFPTHESVAPSAVGVADLRGQKGINSDPSINAVC